MRFSFFKRINLAAFFRRLLVWQGSALIFRQLDLIKRQIFLSNPMLHTNSFQAKNNSGQRHCKDKFCLSALRSLANCEKRNRDRAVWKNTSLEISILLPRILTDRRFQFLLSLMMSKNHIWHGLDGHISLKGITSFLKSVSSFPWFSKLMTKFLNAYHVFLEREEESHCLKTLKLHSAASEIRFDLSGPWNESNSRNKHVFYLLEYQTFYCTASPIKSKSHTSFVVQSSIVKLYNQNLYKNQWVKMIWIGNAKVHPSTSLSTYCCSEKITITTSPPRTPKKQRNIWEIHTITYD